MVEWRVGTEVADLHDCKCESFVSADLQFHTHIWSSSDALSRIALLVAEALHCPKWELAVNRVWSAQKKNKWRSTGTNGKLLPKKILTDESSSCSTVHDQTKKFTQSALFTCEIKTVASDTTHCNRTLPKKKPHWWECVSTSSLPLVPVISLHQGGWLWPLTVDSIKTWCVWAWLYQNYWVLHNKGSV